MEIEEVPEELISPPERRLVQTLITTRPNPKSLTMSLGVIFGVALISQVYWMNWGDWAPLLPAIKEKIFRDNEFWRVFTAILVHGDLGHLASNMYMLGILSYFVYGYFGSKVYPLFTFLGAGFVNLISISTYPDHVQLMGASGWVYLLGGFWLTMYLFIQRQFDFSRRLIRVFGISLMVFFPTTFEATTSYRTHFIGFVIGILMAAAYFILNRRQIREYESFRLF